MPEIKKAGIADIEMIRELACSVWPVAYKKILSPEQLTYMLDLFYSNAALTAQLHSGHHFIIAYENKHAVGFASYSIKSSNNPEIYRLHKLYVLPGIQKKGTGSNLLSYIIDSIKLSGAKILELNVNRYNEAFNFYNKLGFTILREEDIDIGEGYFMNDYVMEKVL